eukprot:SM000278S10021  [mRNA]  locus=s278:92243:98216:- [translate_table: standard]
MATAAPVAAPSVALISESTAWHDLKAHKDEIAKAHLRDLLADQHRCESMIKEFDSIVLDFSRQRVTEETITKLLALAEVGTEAKVKEKIDAMFSGEHVSFQFYPGLQASTSCDRLNATEDRAVLHVALRAPRDKTIMADGKNVVPEVWEVLDKIKAFTDRVRSGEWVGATGKPLTDVVAIGIGGSFLGPLFVHTALATEPSTLSAAEGRSLHFLSNVDPIDVANALHGLNQETTLVVVVSKTFTTAETMLNARTVRTWITSALGPDAVAKHMVAVSTNLKLVKEFGIDPANAFAFWDWVGGRYSVTSAVGVLPLALQYGFEHVHRFLEGAWSVDDHFHTAPLESNVPVLLGLVSVWNVSFFGNPARGAGSTSGTSPLTRRVTVASQAILPYCQALAKLAPHIQQVSMESNGKGVALDGTTLPYESGEIDFGEPGTNGQHSFYQLIHQGRVVPCDFIGIIKSQQSVYLKGEIVSNHDELMCNFFAQADALAYGKTREELRAEGVPDHLIPHKSFTGNRPSLSILLPALTAYTVGQGKTQLLYPEPHDVFPADILKQGAGEGEGEGQAGGRE